MINLIKHFQNGHHTAHTLTFQVQQFCSNVYRGPLAVCASPLRLAKMHTNRPQSTWQKKFICSALLFVRFTAIHRCRDVCMHFGRIAERCRSLESLDCLHCNWRKNIYKTKKKGKGKKNVSVRRRSVSHGVARLSASNSNLSAAHRKLIVCHAFSFFFTSLAINIWIFDEFHSWYPSENRTYFDACDSNGLGRPFSRADLENEFKRRKKKKKILCQYTRFLIFVEVAMNSRALNLQRCMRVDGTWRNTAYMQVGRVCACTRRCIFILSFFLHFALNICQSNARQNKQLGNFHWVCASVEAEAIAGSIGLVSSWTPNEERAHHTRQ